MTPSSSTDAAGDNPTGSFVVVGVCRSSKAPLRQFRMPWGRSRCHWPVSGQAGAHVVRGEWLALCRSVGLALAPTSGAGRLLQGPIVNGLAKVRLPRLGQAACGVRGVEADEVAPDEGERQEHAGGDEPAEDPAVDSKGVHDRVASCRSGVASEEYVGRLRSCTAGGSKVAIVTRNGTPRPFVQLSHIPIAGAAQDRQGSS